MVTHTVKFYRNPSDGHYYSRCFCGWSLHGGSGREDLEKVQAIAATHDLDALDFDTTLPTTFTTGLP